MTEKELKFEILDDAVSSEEFFVLVSTIDFTNKEELDNFLKLISELVNNGFLRCDLGEKRDVEVSYADLCSYASRRLQAKESLNEYPCMCNEYLFTTTDKGRTWLKEQIENTKKIATKIVNAIERYKQEKNLYPKTLGELSPDFLPETLPPIEGCGKWKYLPSNDFTTYILKFGGDPQAHLMHLYDSASKVWSTCDESR